MISRLRGTPAGRTLDGLVIDVGGVGYLVSATPSVLRRADGASEVTVETYLHVREDAMQLYGFADSAERALFVQLLGVSGIGPIRRPDIVELAPKDGGTDRAVTGSRRVFFDDWIDTPTYNRPDLAPGDVVTGPAVIEEFGSTVPVHPGFAVAVDAYGNLLLTKESAQ